jgi:putative membrane protein
VSEFVGNVRLWFAPERLRDEGGTPDHRFSLADERTFLAWLRTPPALIGGGFAVDQFLPDRHRA